MSLIVTQNSLNTLIVTLKEKSVLAVPYYLLKVHNSENVTSYCTLVEESTDTDSYNKFTVSINTSANPLNSELELKTGEYSYPFYEQSTQSNIDPTGLRIVETGLLTCKPQTASTTQKYSSNNPQKIYRG